MIKYYCNKCGDCCKTVNDYINVIISPIDLKRISFFLGMSPRLFLLKYCTLLKIDLGFDCDVYFIKAENGKCVFLQNSLYVIHNVKPIQCKLAPQSFFLNTDLWDYLPCVSKCNVSFEFSQIEKDFVKSLIDGYDY